jgi:hypothetical protein
MQGVCRPPDASVASTQQAVGQPVECCVATHDPTRTPAAATALPPAPNSNDIVSNELSTGSHSWEGNEIKEMIWAVRQYDRQAHLLTQLRTQPAATAGAQQQSHAAAAAGGSSVAAAVGAQQGGELLGAAAAASALANPAAAAAAAAVTRVGNVTVLPSGRRSLQQQHQQQPARPLMIDIGSNVGWFALNAAAAGARVAAFEGACWRGLLFSAALGVTFSGCRCCTPQTFCLCPPLPTTPPPHHICTTAPQLRRSHGLQPGAAAPLAVCVSLAG